MGSTSATAEPPTPVLLLFSGVGSLSEDVCKLRSIAQRSSFYEAVSERLLERHGVALDQAWVRASRGLTALNALDEIALQLAVQLAGAEIARWALSDDRSIVCVGHSIGELGAAVFAGHLTVEEAVDVAVKLAEVAESVQGGGLVYGPILPGDRPASVNLKEDGGAVLGAVAVLDADDDARKRVHTNYPWHHLCYRARAEVAGFGGLVSRKDPTLLLPLVVSSLGGPAGDLGASFWERWSWNGVDLASALSHVRESGAAAAVVEVGAHPMLQGAARAALPGVPLFHLFERGSGFVASARGDLIRLCGGGRPGLLARELARTFPRVELDHDKTWIQNGLTSADLVPAAAKLAARGAFPELSPADFFRFVTPRSLLEGEASAMTVDNAGGHSSPGTTNAKVVINAMSCVLPGNLASPEQLFGFTRAQGDAVGHDPGHDGGEQPAGYVSQVSLDYSSFNLSKSEIAAMDPQQALVLHCVDKLLKENPSVKLPSKTGVFIGAWNVEFCGDPRSVYYPTGTNPSLIAARVSHIFELTGPCKVVNTACASSLDAILEAVQGIKAGAFDAAIAGGVNLLSSQEFSRCMRQSGFLAPGGRCRTFDAGADGYVRGEGCGLVLLTREDLCEGGHFYAEILGGASNHNAGRSASITAPSPQAQEECIHRALLDARVSPGEVSYVECHGTGTALGDPIEYGALARAYDSQDPRPFPMLVGSVKANIGHLESAAGVAGLIHAVMVLRHREVPAMPNLVKVNPHIDLVDHIAVPMENASRGEGLEVAGVSSFGFGGSNTHLILKINQRDKVPLPTMCAAPSAAAAATTHIFRRPSFDQQHHQQGRGPARDCCDGTPKAIAADPQVHHQEVQSSSSFWALVAEVASVQVEPKELILGSGIDSLGLTELFLGIEKVFPGVAATDLARYLGGEFTWADMEADVTTRGGAGVPPPLPKQSPAKQAPVKKSASTVSLDLAAQDIPSHSAAFDTWALPRFPDMIKTTHVGSLPRAKAAEDQWSQLDDVMRKQLSLGITVINDGEIGRLDYASNATQRMTGFEFQDQEDGTAAPQPQDLCELSCVSCRFLSRAGLITLNERVKTCNPICVGRIEYIGEQALSSQCDIIRDRLRANNAGMPGQAFWTSPSPGTMAMFFDNHAQAIYPTYADYLEGIGMAMGVEYRTIVGKGFVLQVDCPDLALSRHTKFKHLGLDAWKRVMELHVRVLNQALQGIPPEKVRIHLCWGNYPGTHHRDVGVEHVLPTAFKINAQGLSFEGANNRHAADHILFAKLSVPEDKVLYPGVVDTCSTSVESAELVCQRIAYFAKIFGPSRVVACTDCGFATTAESSGIQADVAWMKLRMLVAGARQASALFFPKVVPAFLPRPSMRVFYFCGDIENAGREPSRSDIEHRLILVSELSGKDATKVAAHIRLFVDVPFDLKTDGSEMAEIMVKLVRRSLADGERRNCPMYPPEDSCPAAILATLSPSDMIMKTGRLSDARDSYEVVVIGGGVVGLLAANKLLDAGVDVVLLEREAHVGGIWTTFANQTSQVNSSEGSYRIFEDYRKRANRDHSSTSEVRADILRVASRLLAKRRIFTNAGVARVSPEGGRAPSGRKTYSVVLEAGSRAIRCQGVIMAVNDRVGKPRPIQWKGREIFSGQCIDGFGGDATDQNVDWVGKKVVIVGMGAFAVENARTALEAGASHVTVIARRHGTVCPKFIDYINFVHRRNADNTSAGDGAMDTANNSKNMFLWRKLYEESGATMPECWLGQIKHTGHTISVSDVWFVAHHLGMLETQVGEISRFTEGGVVLAGPDEIEISCDVLVRCTGFERNACLVPAISPYETMSRANYLDENVMYLADAYIDDDAFNSFFGSSVVEMSKFYVMVYEHFFSAAGSGGDASLLKDSFLDTEAVSVRDRAWSHYIAGANFLVSRSPEIRAKADELVRRRYLGFVETQTVAEYVEANKREWEELHDLLSQSKVDSSCYIKYPDWNV